MKIVATFFLAAVSMVALATGCSSAKSDQALTTDIQSKMFADPQVKAANITVSVKDGEATISGDVPNEGTHLQAYKIASDTPGVKHVVDQMTMQAAQAAPPAEAEPVAPPPAAKPRHEAVKPARKTEKHEKRQPKATLRAAKTEAEPAYAPPPSPAAAPAASAAQPAVTAAPPQPPPPPQPTRVEIPAGTSVRVQMIDGVDSAVNHTGDTFHATIASPIVVDNQIVVPAGTDVYLKLVNAKSAGHMTGQSQLALELTRMEFQGKSYGLASSDYTQTGASRGKRTAETVGGGAVIGTLLGAVIGGGKGAAIGAATGAGAGGVVQGVTKGEQIKIPSETKLDFSLEQPLEVSYFPDRIRSSRQ
ncbi:MAG: BON domain-containing protein [Acidobacteriia bacterium]|nr:BON domain-containing protein [Terriglobia bacterium]